MAVLHEEVDAVLLEGDGVGVGLGDALDDFEVFDVELEAAGGALVGADFAGDDDAGLLGEALERLEDLGGTLLTWATPWMVPVPSRKMGKSSLPLSRRL
jgi:hypothetical protein